MKLFRFKTVPWCRWIEIVISHTHQRQGFQVGVGETLRVRFSGSNADSSTQIFGNKVGRDTEFVKVSFSEEDCSDSPHRTRARSLAPPPEGNCPFLSIIFLGYHAAGRALRPTGHFDSDLRASPEQPSPPLEILQTGGVGSFFTSRVSCIPLPNLSGAGLKAPLNCLQGGLGGSPFFQL